MTLLIVKNSDKFLKNTVIKVYKNQIMKLNNDRGSIYIPKEEYDSVSRLVKFIKNNSDEKEKILIWNKGSAADQLGTDLLPYFFSGRLPASRYFIVQTGYTNSIPIQEDIIKSLEKDHIKLVVLRSDKETGQTPANSLGLIDSYVDSHYYLAEKINYFYVYMRK